MQAGAAQLVGLLDQCDLEPVLRRANGRRVTGRPAANDRHIENRLCFCLNQGKTPFRGAP